MNVKSKENYGFWAFLPLLVFLMVYFGGGLIYMCLGTPDPFDKIPMVIALLIGIGTTFFMGKGTLDMIPIKGTHILLTNPKSQ